MNKTAIIIMFAAVAAMTAPLQAAPDAAKWQRIWQEHQEETARQPRTYSKLRIEMAIADLGKWAEFETWLGSIEIKPSYPALRAWNSAQVISDGFEGFDTLLEAAKAALGVTDEQAEAILAAAAVQ